MGVPLPWDWDYPEMCSVLDVYINIMGYVENLHMWSTDVKQINMLSL